MWDLPGPEMEPVVPELQGKFFITGPPGKPRAAVYLFGAGLDPCCCTLGCCWILGFSLVTVSGATPAVELELLIAAAPFVSERRLSGAQASVVVAHGLHNRGPQALEQRLNSCGAQGWLLSSMWDLPGPRIEPVYPALAGRFFITEPTQKSESL